jgi:hypothetical protein
MEKRKQQDERKAAGGRQKGGYKRNAKERASVNIQTQNRVHREFFFRIINDFVHRFILAPYIC